MRTELKPQPHSEIPDAWVVEIWRDGNFVGTVVGSDNCGVRVISKHPILAEPRLSKMTHSINVMEVEIAATEEQKKSVKFS